MRCLGCDSGDLSYRNSLLPDGGPVAGTARHHGRRDWRDGAGERGDGRRVVAKRRPWFRRRDAPHGLPHRPVCWAVAHRGGAGGRDLAGDVSVHPAHRGPHSHPPDNPRPAGEPPKGERLDPRPRHDPVRRGTRTGRRTPAEAARNGDAGDAARPFRAQRALLGGGELHVSVGRGRRGLFPDVATHQGGWVVSRGRGGGFRGVGDHGLDRPDLLGERSRITGVASSP